MISETKVLIHIGLMKTGTTYLQTRFFPKLPNIKYFFGMDSFYKGRFFSMGPMGKIVISNEGITGNWYKELDLGLDYFQRFNYSVQNIKNIFNNPYVIIFFREPSSFIYSSYKQYLNEGGTKTWIEFLPENYNNSDFLDQFKFSKWIKLLEENISPERLFVYSYSDFKKRPEIFFERILKFIYEDSVDNNDISKINFHSKSNPSIPDNLIPVYILSNKFSKMFKRLTGFSPIMKLGRYELGLNLVIRYFFTKIIVSKSTTNLEQLKSYFEEDWMKCELIISQKNRDIKNGIKKLE